MLCNTFNTVCTSMCTQCLKNILTSLQIFITLFVKSCMIFKHCVCSFPGPTTLNKNSGQYHGVLLRRNTCSDALKKTNKRVLNIPSLRSRAFSTSVKMGSGPRKRYKYRQLNYGITLPITIKNFPERSFECTRIWSFVIIS